MTRRVSSSRACPAMASKTCEARKAIRPSSSVGMLRRPHVEPLPMRVHLENWLNRRSENAPMARSEGWLLRFATLAETRSSRFP